MKPSFQQNKILLSDANRENEKLRSKLEDLQEDVIQLRNQLLSENIDEDRINELSIGGSSY